MRGTASARLSGYRQALRAAGLPYDPELVIDVPHYDRADGHAAMLRLLELPDPPDAVFCFNDLMAIGALRACVESGVRVPEDIAIAGFDDIAETRYSNPTVTTVSPDLTGLAREALELLSRRISGDDSPAREVKVSWTLEARETTLGVPDRLRLTPSGAHRRDVTGACRRPPAAEPNGHRATVRPTNPAHTRADERWGQCGQAVRGSDRSSARQPTRRSTTCVSSFRHG